MLTNNQTVPWAGAIYNLSQYIFKLVLNSSLAESYLALPNFEEVKSFAKSTAILLLCSVQNDFITQMNGIYQQDLAICDIKMSFEGIEYTGTGPAFPLGKLKTNIGESFAYYIF